MMGRGIPVTINGVTYPSRAAAARATGSTTSNICAAARKGSLHRVGCGKGGPEALPVRIRGVDYPGGAAEAAAALGVTVFAIYHAIRLGDPDRVGRPRGRKGGHSTGKPFRLGGMEWPSRLAAERALGLPRHYISQVLHKGSKAGRQRIVAAAMRLRAQKERQAA